MRLAFFFFFVKEGLNFGRRSQTFLRMVKLFRQFQRHNQIFCKGLNSSERAKTRYNNTTEGLIIKTGELNFIPFLLKFSKQFYIS